MKKISIILILIISLSSILCNGFSGDKYQRQTAKDKHQEIWSAITSNTTPYGWFSAIFLGGIFLEDMSVTFNEEGDILPFARQKFIHTVGNVGKVHWVAEPDQPYTGIFKGAEYGFARLSCAKEPITSNPTPEAAYENFLPGFGLKFMRNNVPSANFIAMHSLRGQKSWNFFANSFSNHISTVVNQVSIKLLVKKFESATPFAGTLGTRHVATWDQDGNLESNPKFPFSLVFEPSDAVKNLYPDFYETDFTQQIASVKVNTDLYNVMANDEPNGKYRKIASIRLVEEGMTTSKWGDKELFFRHYFWEDDLQLHPDWEQNRKEVVEIFRQAYLQKKNPHGNLRK